MQERSVREKYSYSGKDRNGSSEERQQLQNYRGDVMWLGRVKVLLH